MTIPKLNNRKFSVSRIDDRTAGNHRNKPAATDAGKSSLDRTPFKANPIKKQSDRPFNNLVPTTQTTKPRNGRRTATGVPMADANRLTAGWKRRRRK